MLVVEELFDSLSTSTIKLPTDTEGQEATGRQQHRLFSAVNSSRTAAWLSLIGFLVVVVETLAAAIS